MSQSTVRMPAEQGHQQTRSRGGEGSNAPLTTVEWEVVRWSGLRRLMQRLCKPKMLLMKLEVVMPSPAEKLGGRVWQRILSHLLLCAATWPATFACTREWHISSPDK